MKYPRQPTRRHLRSLAVLALSNPSRPESRGDVCLRCGQPGHTSSSCPVPFPKPGQGEPPPREFDLLGW